MMYSICTENDNYTTNYTCNADGVVTLGGFLQQDSQNVTNMILYNLFFFLCVFQGLVSLCLVLAFRNRLGFNQKRHKYLLVVGAACMFPYNALWVPNEMLYFVPCNSWLHTSISAQNLLFTLELLSDLSFYTGIGIFLFSIYQRLKLLTLGESTILTKNRYLHFTLVAMIVLMLALGLFVQAPILLYMDVDYSMAADVAALWNNLSYNIYQPLVCCIVALMDILL